MNITIIDGNHEKPDIPNEIYRKYLTDFVELMLLNGHKVEHFQLAKMQLRLCNGCWSCWVKTPGRCSQKDHSFEVIKAYFQSDLVLFATPLSLGFLTAKMKTMLDKCVALFLPHIEIHKGEFVHSKRYKKYPAVACLLQQGAYDSEDLEITREYFRRYAFHFQTSLSFEASLDQTPKELYHAISHI